MIQERQLVDPALTAKLFTIHDALELAGIPHAVGGAINLIFCTRHPRRTSDVDINISLGVEHAGGVLDALPETVARGPADVRTVTDCGQVRLCWEGTKLDLFFNNLPIHEEAARSCATAWLEGREIPVLDVASLVAFKAMFDRPVDWTDIENIVDSNHGPVAVRPVASPR